MGKARRRLISHSEVAKAMTCEAQWDFAYGDALAGSSLKPKALAPGLSTGRAWGAAVAAWHMCATTDPSHLLGPMVMPQVAAEMAMLDSLAHDAKPQLEAGVFNEDRFAEVEWLLRGLIEHYTECSEPMAIQALERKFEVPLPSRGGKRSSSKYSLLAFVDAVTTAALPWLVEFKLRGTLLPASIIIRSRQIRWYAWAYREEMGVDIGGVWVEERLKEVPRPARVVKARRKGEGIDGMLPSHAVDQMTTSRAYRKLCADYGVEPVGSVIDALDSRVWQHRVPVVFRPGELDESGRELVSAARLIAQLDSGALYPIRNAKRSTCNYCDFEGVCEAPRDGHVETDFVRRPAKRDRKDEQDGTASIQAVPEPDVSGP